MLVVQPVSRKGQMPCADRRRPSGMRHAGDQDKWRRYLRVTRSSQVGEVRTYGSNRGDQGSLLQRSGL